MKRYLTIMAALAALAMPAAARAEGQSCPPADAAGAPSAAVPGSVDAAELANLLEEKGVISPREQGQLTHAPSTNGSPSVDAETMRRVFRTAPYTEE